MTYSEICDICKKGHIGRIPGWIGYLHWDYSNQELYFKNFNYILKGDELKNKILNRKDLYYII